MRSTEKTRLLVAEDFDLLREDWCELINAQDDMVCVGAAASGGEIEKLALEVECDIILMDIEMETANAGILATERIRSEKPQIQVIFLTAHDTDDMIITAMGSGAVDYCIKGSGDGELLRHIRAVVAGRPVLDAGIQEKIMREYTRLRRSERSLLFFINNISRLTPAERELVSLLLKGLKTQEIAAARCVELVTVKTQIKSLLNKFGCSRTKEIVQMIRDLNISHLF